MPQPHNGVIYFENGDHMVLIIFLLFLIANKNTGLKIPKEIIDNIVNTVSYLK